MSANVRKSDQERLAKPTSETAVRVSATNPTGKATVSPEILEAVPEKWRSDFFKFIDSGEASEAFWAFLDGSRECQTAVDKALDHEVLESPDLSRFAMLAASEARSASPYNERSGWRAMLSFFGAATGLCLLVALPVTIHALREKDEALAISHREIARQHEQIMGLFTDLKTAEKNGPQLAVVGSLNGVESSLTDFKAEVSKMASMLSSGCEQSKADSRRVLEKLELVEQATLPRTSRERAHLHLQGSIGDALRSIAMPASKLRASFWEPTNLAVMTGGEPRSYMFSVNVSDLSEKIWEIVPPKTVEELHDKLRDQAADKVRPVATQMNIDKQDLINYLRSDDFTKVIDNYLRDAQVGILAERDDGKVTCVLNDEEWAEQAGEALISAKIGRNQEAAAAMRRVMMEERLPPAPAAAVGAPGAPPPSEPKKQ